MKNEMSAEKYFSAKNEFNDDENFNVSLMNENDFYSK